MISAKILASPAGVPCRRAPARGWQWRKSIAARSTPQDAVSTRLSPAFIRSKQKAINFDTCAQPERLLPLYVPRDANFDGADGGQRRRSPRPPTTMVRWGRW